VESGFVKKQVLVNSEENEIRAAFLEDDQLVDLFIEKMDDLSSVGNLYKGIVEDVVPGLKAAFIDIGMERKAFLHFNDFSPEALSPADKNSKGLIKRIFSIIGKEEEEQIKPPPRRQNMDPAAVLQKGQTLIVQVIKDEIGRKGPRVSSNIAIPGRYLVLLPYPSQRGGISRKIENEKERQRLRRILGQIRTGDRSFIIRTAGMGMSDEAIKSDIGHLKHIWANILRKFREKGAPFLLHNDHDILYRIVRDNFSEDIDEIIVDYVGAEKQIKRILRQMIPGLADRIRLFTQPSNLFHYYNVEKQIKRACERRVWLRSGGSVVFDETEALTAIDVNSGRFVSKKNQEKTVLKTNMEACKVIAQQLRLRDIGGIIVIDFIDMKEHESRKSVEHEIQRLLKADRAKSTILPISEFGLVEITRKRVRQSLRHQIFSKCPYCEGSGRVLAPSQIWLQIKYTLLDLLQKRPRPQEVTVMAHPRTKKYLQEKLQAALDHLANKYKTPISLLSSEDLHIEDFQVRYTLSGKSEMVSRGVRNNQEGRESSPNLPEHG
jgi:ribonuclease G